MANPLWVARKCLVRLARASYPNASSFSDHSCNPRLFLPNDYSVLVAEHARRTFSDANRVSNRPFVSVVVPCRNEETYISSCLESLADNDYPRNRYEVIVVDGMSSDGSREIIGAAAARHPMIRRLDNPVRDTPVGMNVGVAASCGDIILIAGAHNRYDRAFLSRLANNLARYPEADAVGGVILTRPRTGGRVGRGIAVAISDPFGVGPSRFRTIPSKPVWADAAFGCGYRRAVFERVGMFNERLARGQDMEFNLRLRAAGGRILLVPDLTSEYFARSTLSSFWRHNLANGEWAVLPFLHSPMRPVAIRHLIPLGFVLALLVTSLAAPFLSAGRWALLGMSSTYLVLLLAASLRAAWRSRDPILVPFIAAAFASLHIAYGLGSLWGGLQLIGRWIQGERRPSAEQAWPSLDSYSARDAVT